LATADSHGGATAAARSSADGPKFAYIDCLRGYAVLMVMVAHTTSVYAQLPYPAHKIGTFGWNGVQLFFLASSLTLLLSYDQERRRTGAFNARNFFIRRFLRIAPMYYLAAAFYAVLTPPRSPTLAQLAASLAFVNAWTPRTMPTTGDWTVVPGGWSIGVEFTFYLLFPAFVVAATSFRRLLPLLAATVLAAAVLDTLLFPMLTQAYGRLPADLFLYYWLPNQAPVFLVGGLVFLAIRALERQPDHPLSRGVRRWSGAIVGAGLALGLAIAWFPQRFCHQLLLITSVPQHLAATLVFAAFIIGLSQAPRSPLVNRVAASLGKVSFSAYLLHFAVIQLIPWSHPRLFHANAERWSAIAAYGVCCVVVAGVTYLASCLTYSTIEKPFMRLAKRLTQPRRVSAAEIPRLAA
jgi:peptidoglycan/LPS O-acetylase OafA/YrhL